MQTCQSRGNCQNLSWHILAFSQPEHSMVNLEEGIIKPVHVCAKLKVHAWSSTSGNRLREFLPSVARHVSELWGLHPFSNSAETGLIIFDNLVDTLQCARRKGAQATKPGAQKGDPPELCRVDPKGFTDGPPMATILTWPCRILDSNLADLRIPCGWN